MNADQWGVSYGYVDTDGATHRASESTRREIRRALGAPEDPTIPPEQDGAIVVSQGDTWQTHSEAFMHLEDGTTRTLQPGWTLSNDLPTGYHHIQFDDQPSRSFIHAPAACALPNNLRGWGWGVQLYAMRSKQSWGIGDFGDLRTLNEWSARRGARYTLINPLHAATPTPGQQPSPYFPTSRVWRNPLYIRIEDVPGWVAVSSELADIAASAKALLDDRRIDRDRVRVAKMIALERIWEEWNQGRNSVSGDDRHNFTQWRRRQGDALTHFAVYCSLVEQLGGDIREWPSHLADAHATGVAEATLRNAARISFHAWLQWLAECQLAAANAALPVMTDLAIGVDRAGADAWVWPDAFSRTMSVGAPPDTFNTQGQTWGLPPFDPWRLRKLNYEPFIRTVRSAFQSAGALRMDHVMGLFRLWWIPQGNSPKEGCYVYFPFRDLTGILALESHRAANGEGVGVVGEDLGTIEPYVSTELTSRRIVSYKLLQFEQTPSDELPENSMVAVTVHDLPTLAGAYTGTDVIECATIGAKPFAQGAADVRASLMKRAGLSQVEPDNLDDLFGCLNGDDRTLVYELLGLNDQGEPIAPLDLQTLAACRAVKTPEIAARLRHINDLLSEWHRPLVRPLIDGLTADLARSTSRLICTSLDDALAVEERPNVPGSIDERPNWRIALPSPLEVILAHPGVESIAAALSLKGSS